MLAIFDNDGTICDTQEVEGRCYAEAIETVTGRSLTTLDWTSYREPTSTAIIRDILSGDPEASTKEQAIKVEFLRLLERERPKFPGDFSPISGAVHFIKSLQKDKVCSVAIATGCFDTTAAFKLKCCGINLYDFPHATASDTPRRRDIIPLAASRAGFDLSSVIYFGDAPWDVKVSNALGIRMIGMGRRISQLKDMGVGHVFRDYSNPTAIRDVLKIMKSII